MLRTQYYYCEPSSTKLAGIPRKRPEKRLSKRPWISARYPQNREFPTKTHIKYSQDSSQLGLNNYAYDLFANILAKNLHVYNTWEGSIWVYAKMNPIWSTDETTREQKVRPSYRYWPDSDGRDILSSGWEPFRPLCPNVASKWAVK